MKLGTLTTKRRAAAAAEISSRPIEQQIVIDPSGKTGLRRFHGAFTGGFSAGHFNTCGSETGWTPSTFVSTRGKERVKRKRPEDFMDNDDDPLLGRSLVTRSSFAAGQGAAAIRGRAAFPVSRQPHGGGDGSGGRSSSGGGVAKFVSAFDQGAPAPPDRGAALPLNDWSAGSLFAAAFPEVQPVAAVSGGTSRSTRARADGASVGYRLLRTMGWRPGAGVGARKPLAADAIASALASTVRLAVEDVAVAPEGECSFIYRYILHESCSQFDSPPLTSLTISQRACSR